MTPIQDKVKEYIQLKKSKKAIEKRLQDLRKDFFTVGDASLKACGLARQERDYTTYNEDRVFELLDKKGYERKQYCNLVIDPSKIEEMYLNDYLTDTDLRYIRNPKYGYALIEVDKDV